MKVKKQQLKPDMRDWLKIWKAQKWSQGKKRSVFVPIPKKGNAKEWSNYHSIVLISRASKVMLKILQAMSMYGKTNTVL